MTILPRFLDAETCARFVAIWREHHAAGRSSRQPRGYHFEWLTAVPEILNAPALAKALRALDHEQEPWDSFFVYYAHGDQVAMHTDARRLRRLNVLVLPPTSGGELVIEDAILEMQQGDAVIFEPSKQRHAVNPVDGERLVWSVGLHTTPWIR